MKKILFLITFSFLILFAGQKNQVNAACDVVQGCSSCGYVRCANGIYTSTNPVCNTTALCGGAPAPAPVVTQAPKPVTQPAPAPAPTLKACSETYNEACTCTNGTTGTHQCSKFGQNTTGQPGPTCPWGAGSSCGSCSCAAAVAAPTPVTASTKGLANGASSGCCTTSTECAGWFGNVSTCTTANGACASGLQCHGSGSTTGGTTCVPTHVCGAGDCAVSNGCGQICNAGCKGTCGNGICESTNAENATTCAADCKATPKPTPSPTPLPGTCDNTSANGCSGQKPGYIFAIGTQCLMCQLPTGNSCVRNIVACPAGGAAAVPALPSSGGITDPASLPKAVTTGGGICDSSAATSFACVGKAFGYVDPTSIDKTRSLEGQCVPHGTSCLFTYVSTGAQPVVPSGNCISGSANGCFNIAVNSLITVAGDNFKYQCIQKSGTAASPLCGRVQTTTPVASTTNITNAANANSNNQKQPVTGNGTTTPTASKAIDTSTAIVNNVLTAQADCTSKKMVWCPGTNGQSQCLPANTLCSAKPIPVPVSKLKCRIDNTQTCTNTNGTSMGFQADSVCPTTGVGCAGILSSPAPSSKAIPKVTLVPAAKLPPTTTTKTPLTLNCQTDPKQLCNTGWRRDIDCTQYAQGCNGTITLPSVNNKPPVVVVTTQCKTVVDENCSTGWHSNLKCSQFKQDCAGVVTKTISQTPNTTFKNGACQTANNQSCSTGWYYDTECTQFAEACIGTVTSTAAGKQGTVIHSSQSTGSATCNPDTLTTCVFPLIPQCVGNSTTPTCVTAPPLPTPKTTPVAVVIPTPKSKPTPIPPVNNLCTKDGLKYPSTGASGCCTGKTYLDPSGTWMCGPKPTTTAPRVIAFGETCQRATGASNWDGTCLCNSGTQHLKQGEICADTNIQSRFRISNGITQVYICKNNDVNNCAWTNVTAQNNNQLLAQSYYDTESKLNGSVIVTLKDGTQVPVGSAQELQAYLDANQLNTDSFNAVKTVGTSALTTQTTVNQNIVNQINNDATLTKDEKALLTQSVNSGTDPLVIQQGKYASSQFVQGGQDWLNRTEAIGVALRTGQISPGEAVTLIVYQTVDAYTTGGLSNAKAAQTAYFNCLEAVKKGLNKNGCTREQLSFVTSIALTTAPLVGPANSAVSVIKNGLAAIKAGSLSLAESILGGGANSDILSSLVNSGQTGLATEVVSGRAMVLSNPGDLASAEFDNLSTQNARLFSSQAEHLILSNQDQAFVSTVKSTLKNVDANLNGNLRLASGIDSYPQALSEAILDDTRVKFPASSANTDQAITQQYINNNGVVKIGDLCSTKIGACFEQSVYDSSVLDQLGIKNTVIHFDPTNSSNVGHAAVVADMPVDPTNPSAGTVPTLLDPRQQKVFDLSTPSGRNQAVNYYSNQGLELSFDSHGNVTNITTKQNPINLGIK
jgi:hypothetical protein